MFLFAKLSVYAWINVAWVILFRLMSDFNVNDVDGYIRICRAVILITQSILPWGSSQRWVTFLYQWSKYLRYYMTITFFNAFFGRRSVMVWDWIANVKTENLLLLRKIQTSACKLIHNVPLLQTIGIISTPHHENARAYINHDFRWHNVSFCQQLALKWPELDFPRKSSDNLDRRVRRSLYMVSNVKERLATQPKELDDITQTWHRCKQGAIFTEFQNRLRLDQVQIKHFCQILRFHSYDHVWMEMMKFWKWIYW